jgi:hypothetical protein
MTNRVRPARASRSRSPVTSRSAFPPSARSRNGWSFLSRQDNLDFLVTLTISQQERYSASSSSLLSEESWNFGYRNTRVSSSTVVREANGKASPRRQCGRSQARRPPVKSSADTTTVVSRFRGQYGPDTLRKAESDDWSGWTTLIRAYPATGAWATSASATAAGPFPPRRRQIRCDFRPGP